MRYLINTNVIFEVRTIARGWPLLIDSQRVA
jgi:hypothetical protein